MFSTKNNTNLVLIQFKKKSRGRLADKVTWVEYRQVWVSIVPNRGREVKMDGEITSKITHTIRGDFLELEGVDVSMRIIANDTHEYDPIADTSRVYDILAVMPDEDHHADVMIQCELVDRQYSKIGENAAQ